MIIKKSGNFSAWNFRYFKNKKINFLINKKMLAIIINFFYSTITNINFMKFN